MKGKIAAILVLIYAVILFLGAVQGAILGRDFSIATIPVTALVVVGPAVGILRRINWCRIVLGIWAVFVFGLVVAFSFRANFHFRPAYLGWLLATGLPVFLLFFYPPLKRHTQHVSIQQTSA